MNFNEYIPNGGWLKRSAKQKRNAKRIALLKTIAVYTGCIIIAIILMVVL